MKNLTLIIALIIGTSFTLSAQRGGGLSNNSNTGSNNNSSLRSNPNVNRNSNVGPSQNYEHGPSRYGRNGSTRPGSYGSTGRGGRHGSGHHNHHGQHNTHHHNNTTHHHHHYNNRPYYAPRPNRVVTVTYHGHHYNGYCNYSNHNYGWRPVCVADFNAGCYSVRSCGFDSERLRAAKRFVRNHYVSAYQIADMMAMFSFESTRLAFAKFAFHRACDVHHYGVVFDALSFHSSRRELDCYIRDYRW